MDGRRQVFYCVKELAALGLSDYRIAERTGVKRSTVQRWRHRGLPPWVGLALSDVCWGVTNAPAYCYLLGCYLGDGHLNYKPPRCWTLRIACDRQYEGIMGEIRRAMEATFPGRRATRIQASTGASDIVSICHPAVGDAFPQHDAGRKHLRPIVLEEWQLELTRANPGQLIRGLIHSDGCRAENRFQTKLPSGRVAQYAYVRYFFTNLSTDIRAIFVEHCRLLGVRVTQSNHRNLSVAHRTSVAILEKTVGPKA